MAIVKIQKDGKGEIVDCHEEHVAQFAGAGWAVVEDKPKAPAKAKPKAKAPAVKKKG